MTIARSRGYARFEVPRVTVSGPEGPGQHVLELEQGAQLLVGRAPTPASLKPEALGECLAPPKVLTMATPSISANHVLVRAEPCHLVIRDLGSRNGTWLLLPPKQNVRVDGGTSAVLQLARSCSEYLANDDPPAPEWGAPREFARALVSSVESWPRLRGLDVEIRVLDETDAGKEFSIPLASGEALSMVPRATTDANWGRTLEKLWHWVARQNATFEAEERTRSEGVILASQAIRAAHAEVVAAAHSCARALLLMGPSGAGKEVMAEVFHRHSGQNGPFIALNCALLNKELVRAELFGAEPGSFTGATRRIIGAVERAQGGTLFLDEIGELPPDVQPMLLRFLDRNEFEPLGRYGQAQRADVRVVVASNKDLRSAARDGSFRTDLWFRLSVHVVEVPGLRTRFDDIKSYLEQERVGANQRGLYELFSDDALEVLRQHPWEGNFRELTNFRARLLREDTAPSRVDAQLCRRVLAEGALRPSRSPCPSAPGDAVQGDWSALAARAVEAFAEDFGHPPGSWNEQKEWNEKYLKPLLFHELAGLEARLEPPSDDELAPLASRAAQRAGADRGTALKQLTRYYRRYRV